MNKRTNKRSKNKDVGSKSLMRRSPSCNLKFECHTQAFNPELQKPFASILNKYSVFSLVFLAGFWGFFIFYKATNAWFSSTFFYQF